MHIAFFVTICESARSTSSYNNKHTTLVSRAEHIYYFLVCLYSIFLSYTNAQMMKNRKQNMLLFYIVGTILILWNLMGLASFLYHELVYFTNETYKTLSSTEQQLFDSYPLWTDVVFAIATFCGVAASIFFIAKSKHAITLFFLSTIAVIIQMIHSLCIAGAWEVYGAEAIVMPIFIVVMGIVGIFFSLHYKAKVVLK